MNFVLDNLYKTSLCNQIVYKLTERQLLNDTLNITNIANQLNVSIITLKRDFQALRKLGYIKRVGSKKTGHWEVII